MVYLPLLIPALAAIAARPLAARLEPQQATWLLTAAALALAGCSTVALALLAASAAAQVPVLADLGNYSESVIHRADPTSAVTGAVAAGVLTVAAVAVAVAFRHRARALAESYRRAARLHDDGTVVVQRGAAVEAYALPGWPGRIARRCSRTSGPIWRAGITCSPRWRTWPRPPTRSCSRWPARWITPWNAGPTSTPPGSPAIAAWWRSPSAGWPCSPLRAACQRPPSASSGRAPAGCRWPGPGPCPAGSPPCSGRHRARGCCCWPPPC